MTAYSSSAIDHEDMASLVLKILADGGSKNLVDIRSKLTTITTEFVELDTVMKTCDKLVEQGKLKRTGTGEFFAQYSLAGPS